MKKSIEVIRSHFSILFLITAFMVTIGFFEIKKFILEPDAYKFVQNSLELSEVFSWLVASKNITTTITPKFFLISLTQHLLITILGLNLSLLVGKLLFSILNILIFYKIYKKYTNELWSIFLTLISMIAFSSFPFRHFIYQLIQGQITTNMATVDIISFPMPSVNIFFFLIGFYITMESKKIDLNRILLLAIFWSSQLYLNALNFYFGWPLLIATICLRCRINERIKYLFISLFLTLSLSIPWFYSFIRESLKSSEYIYFISREVLDSAAHFNTFYYLCYFIFPIILLLLTYSVLKIDYIELVKRFYFVPVFILLELLIVTLDGVLGAGRLSNYLFSRLFIFVHFFYLLPVINLFLRPFVIDPRFGTESGRPFRFVAWFFKSMIENWSKYILPVMIAFLVLFGSLSSRNSLRKKMKLINDSKLYLQSPTRKPDCPVERQIIQELLGTFDVSKVSYINNSFSTRLSDKEILKRMIVFFKVNGLSLADFEQFIRSKKLDNLEFLEFENLSNKTFIDIGLGRWLLFAPFITLGNEVKESFYIDAIRLFNQSDVKNIPALKKCM